MPRPIINEEMKEFILNNITFMTNDELAECLGIEPYTLRGYLYRHNIKRNYPINLLDGEIFEYCPSLPKKYKVSNKGRIMISNTNKILRVRKNKEGKVYCTLYLDKETKCNKLVAKLVAETFIPNPRNRHSIGYKNEDKGDIEVSNLEWI